MGQALSGVTALPQRVIRSVAAIGLACVAGVCADAVAAAADIASKARKLIAVRMVISCGATRLIVNWSPGSKGKKSIPGSGLRRKRIDRKSVESGKRVSVRVVLGGRRIIKKKTKPQQYTEPYT